MSHYFKFNILRCCFQMWKCGLFWVCLLLLEVILWDMDSLHILSGLELCIAQALLELVVFLLPLLDFWGFRQVSPSPKGCTILNSHQYVPFAAPKCPFIPALPRDSLIPFMFTFGLKWMLLLLSALGCKSVLSQGISPDILKTIEEWELLSGSLWYY